MPSSKSKRLLFHGLAGLSLIVSACREQPSQPEAVAVALTIAAPETSVVSGNSLQLQAVAHLSNGDTSRVTGEVQWSITPGIAGQILPDGRFLAATNALGVETVQADYHGLHAVVSLAVTKRARSLGVSPAVVDLASGATLQFSASAVYEDGTQEFVNDKVKWSLFPGRSATIDAAGLLRALPNLTGAERVLAKYQSFTVQSEIEIQAGTSLPFEMATIPAGSFIMGEDAGRADERPAHEVQIDAFQIGKYEVTNAQYVNFLNHALLRGDIVYETGIITARRGTFAHLPYLKICPTAVFPERLIEYNEVETNQFEFRAERGYENFPAARLTWYGAAAFCEFYGLRLPTEAEWEQASQGGQQLDYGTADGALTHDLANYAGSAGTDAFERLAPVGSFPPNPFGIHDLAGNVAEFVFDVYDENYYSMSPAANPIGPGPARPLGRLQLLNGQPAPAILRGGSWLNSASFCRAAARMAFPGLPDQCEAGGAIGGFRVARSLP